MGHRRRRNGVVGAIHRRGDVREVREGGGRGAARGVGVGWEARRREAAALKHTGDAARRGHGEGAHPVRLGSTSGRRVGADHSPAGFILLRGDLNDRTNDHLTD